MNRRDAKREGITADMGVQIRLTLIDDANERGAKIKRAGK